MKPIVIDFETYWAPDYSLSVKPWTTQTYIRDKRFKVHGAGIKNGKDGKSVWVPGPLLPQVFAKLDIPNSALVGHHLNFDGSILAWHYGYVPARYVDTLAMSRAVIGQHSSRHSLHATAGLLLDGLDKYPGFLTETRGVRTLPPDMEKRLATYCAGPVSPCGRYAGDVILTWEVLKKMYPYVSAKELDYMDWTIRIFTQPQILLDTDMLWQYHRDVVASKEKILADLGLENRDMLMSAERYADALRQLGVAPPMKWSKPTKKNPEGAPTYAFAKTDEGHKELLDHPDYRVQSLVAARMAVKSTQEETRSLKYAVASELGPWPVHINASGAKNTQRGSGGDGGGGNPQNLKRGGVLRDTLMAPEGKVFIVPDFSQIEARITLWLGSKMPNANMEREALLNLMRGDDIYGWFGSHIYGMEITKESHPYERQVAKSAVLGLGFGMGDERFIEYCAIMGVKDMTPELAKRVKNLYRSMFSGVKQFWDVCNKNLLPSMVAGTQLYLPNEEFKTIKLGKDIFDHAAIVLPNGLMIKYPHLTKGENGWKYKDGQGDKNWVKLFGGKVTENIVQALAGVMAREATVELHEPGYIDVVHTVHDELPTLIDTTPDIVAYLKRKKLNSMRSKADRVPNPLPSNAITDRIVHCMTKERSYMPGLPIAVEYDFGYRYGDCK